MKVAQMRIVVIDAVFMTNIFLLFPSTGVFGNFMTRNVGQDVIFKWNRTSGSVSEARWGLFSSSDNLIKPLFISINKFDTVPRYSSDLDTSAASSYKGRVSWVGDLNTGHVWFKITNLSISDTNQYGVRVTEGSTNTFLKIQLIVAATPQFTPQPPQTKNIEEGQDLSVPCTAIGPPTPNITWIQLVGHVTKSTGTGSATLTISNIRRDKNGARYECQAWNNPNVNPVTVQTMINVYYSPQATISSPSVTVTQDEEITLTCTTTGNPLPSISWTKDGGDIKTGHTVAGGTLRIPDAIKTDAGQYICTANNTYNSKSHIDTETATVVVQYQPSIHVDKLLKQKSTFNESESLTLSCEADGHTTPTFNWKTPSGTVHNGKTLNIASVKRSDAGKYTCTASNGIGRAVNSSIQVNVQYKPVINESSSTRTFESWSGHSIRLQCFSAGLPTPVISWYKPTDQQITTGVNIIPRGSEVTVQTTTDSGDYGQYKCRATNILGSDEHLMNVTQLFPPGLVSIKVTEVEASSITLSWVKPTDDGGRPVTSYLLEVSTKPPKKTVNTHAIVSGLEANTQYTVKVYAQNGVGYGLMSSKIINTKKIGKPAIPEIVTALLQTRASMLTVTLRWTKPADNGDKISRYTIYMKEVTRQDGWTNIVGLTGLSPLEYTVTIVQGNTYKFIVTAWNKYGESVMDETSAKTINTTVEKATFARGIKCSTQEGLCPAVFGVICAFFILSLGLNILQFVWIKRKGTSGRKGFPSQKRQTPKKTDDDEVYYNDVEMEDNTVSSAAVKPSCLQQTEYENIQQPSNMTSDDTACTSNDPRHSQGLNLPLNTFVKESEGSEYEHIRSRPFELTSQSKENELHAYQPLNVRNISSDYQHLQTNSKDSVI